MNNTQQELIHAPLKQVYRKYLFNSIFASLATSLFIFFDTLFLGQGVGSAGLATITFSMPILMVFSAISSFMAYGGPSVFAVELGRGDQEGAADVFSLGLNCAVMLAVACAAFCLLFLRPICSLMGATEDILPMVTTYVGILVASQPFMSLSACLGGYVRNDGQPRLSMIATLCSNLFNIVFDYVFIMVFHWGVAGAAIATALSPLVTIGILCTHFRSGSCNMRYRLNKAQFRYFTRVAKNGLMGFLNEASAGVVTYLYNFMAMRYGGVTAVAAYALVGNTCFIFQNLIISCCMSSQPIIGINYGAGEKGRVREVIGLVLKYAMGLAGALGAVYFLFRTPISTLFANGDDPMLVPTAAFATIFFAVCLLFMPFFYTPVSALFAVEHSRYSNTAVFLRSFVLQSLFLILLPLLWGINGVWLTPIFTEICAAAVALFLFKKAKIV